MIRLDEHQITFLLLSVALVLGSARLMGAITQRFGQPAILGELLAGILLGPTLLARFAPDTSATLFPTQGPLAVALDGLRTLSIVLFMLYAGLEVDLATVRRQGRSASVVGLAGILLPFTIGFAAAWCFPAGVGFEPPGDRFIFAALVATAMSISALPVIARTLMDLNLYRSDLGMIVIAAAIFNDLVGWILFALILGAAGAVQTPNGYGAAHTIGLTLAFVLVLLTVGRLALHRLLPWISVHAGWPGGFLALAFLVALVGAACTTWIGVHPIFGAFLCGIALGDSPLVREHTKQALGDFVSAFFAPLFFASIGLRVDFIQHFDLTIVATVMFIAVIGKVVGCGLGARWTGIAPREAWGIGVCLNARGAMEIIIGLIALQSGLIGPRLFVALVIMALTTSMMVGPIMRAMLRLKKARSLAELMAVQSCPTWIESADRRSAISQLSSAAAAASGLEAQRVFESVWSREELMSTGMGNGVAVPHARFDELKSPVVVLGLSGAGIDFNAPDGEPAHLVFLILTPASDDGAQIEILAEIARVFSSPEARGEAMRLRSHADLAAIIARSQA